VLAIKQDIFKWQFYNDIRGKNDTPLAKIMQLKPGYR